MDIRSLVIARFAVKPGIALTWQLTPASLPVIQKWGIDYDHMGNFVPPDEWRMARDLTRYYILINDNVNLFRDCIQELIDTFPKTLEECTVFITAAEYGLLLNFAGREIYDFFVFDHRFGPPPRGKIFRSNLRGTWKEKVGANAIRRPDMALIALRRKIREVQALGPSGDVTALKAEYARREAAIKAGIDPMIGLRLADKRNTPCPICGQNMTSSGMTRHMFRVHPKEFPRPEGMPDQRNPRIEDE